VTVSHKRDRQLHALPAAMGGQRGSNGVVPGDTELGDLGGHVPGSMSWACERRGWGHGWVTQPGAPAGLRAAHVFTLRWGGI
jgi:hypothetical protein